MKIPENDKIPVDLIARFLSGEASADEIIDIERWKSVSEYNEKTFREYESLWRKTGQANIFTDIDIDEEWNNFLHAVEPEETAKHKTSFYIYRIAAVLLVGLVLGLSSYLIYNKAVYSEYHAENEVISVFLPDGSDVSLNRNSSIKFRKSFKNERAITLDGEAFFNVTKKDGRSFIVQTGNVYVEVVGTSFSVRAYDEEENIRVVVESGRVAVYEPEEPDNKEILDRGDLLDYIKKSGSVIIDKNNDPNYHAWKTGKLIFEAKTLGYLLKTLEGIFDVEFRVENPAILSCPITVSFENRDIEYIINTVAKTLDIKVEKNGSQIILKGDGC